MLILHDHCGTICPTFWGKTSDISVETSDIGRFFKTLPNV